MLFNVRRLPLTIPPTERSRADILAMTVSLSVTGIENQCQMRGGLFYLQSVQLVGFVPYSGDTINVKKYGGRLAKADNVEQAPVASAAGSVLRNSGM